MIKRAAFSLIAVILLLAGAELTLRALYWIAGSAPYQAIRLSWILDDRIEFDGREGLLLGDGWDQPERWSDGGSYRWMTGQSAILRLPVIRRRNLLLTVRAAPFDYPGAPPQRLTLSVNGTEIGTVQMRQSTAEYEFRIRDDQLRLGTNHLAFRVGYMTKPSAVIQGNPETRKLGVAFDWVTIRSIWRRVGDQEHVGADQPRTRVKR